ncbi:hypothetical protein [Aestuariibaculum sediminum]|uniref:Uncharacterized protein n=1 Tax=Aestuariibaculum sediminum TaxID=2770637 RepID=A0A8J6Q8M5_9FLAO|nr:hypothetical protein [Aestuariibaculum sediminum]MBD0832865.1 hypothetical protein [Aestuariibaculum sediminum]
MGQTEFDKDIKGKLEQRLLKPSEHSWDKLSNDLKAIEAKNKKTNLKRMLVAAAVIAALFVVYFNVSKNKEVPIIVNVPTDVESNNEHIQGITKQEDIKVVVETIIEQTPKSTSQKITLPKNADKVVNKIDSEVKPEAIKVELNQLEKTVSIEDQKVKEVVAQINELKKLNKEVTDEEIEMLLLEAQRSIHAQKIMQQSSGMASADVLLMEVETELDQSFRNKVFEAIKSSFGTVKTAVVQRNN